MPWMLLTPPHEADAARAPSRADGIGMSCAADADAWILLGDLDAALYQAGMIDAVIEHLPHPHLVFAGGFSALNALLALEGRALAFRAGWERVRAAHVLSAAALERAHLALLARNGKASLASPRSMLLEAAAALSPDAPELHLLVGHGFVDAHTIAPGEALAVISKSLRQHPDTSAFAAAITASVARGARRLFALGADERWLATTEVNHALDEAREHESELLMLPLAVRERPGVFGYLLPGLGRADRLIACGRAAGTQLVESWGGQAS